MAETEIKNETVENKEVVDAKEEVVNKAPEAEIDESEESANNSSEEVTATLFKVFVGNVDYKVTDEQFKEHFKECKFEDAAINKRKDVSVGYGFITFSDEEEAKKCVAKFDKTDFDGRQIKVEMAKEKVQGRIRTRRSSRRSLRRGNNGRRNSYRNRKTTNGKKKVGKDEKETDAPKDASATSENESSNEVASSEGESNSEATSDSKKGGRKTNGKRRFRKRFQQRKPREGGEPSKTTIYIANLPFKTDEQKLKEAFDGYKVTEVHIARYHNGKSKGFGFIDVENEEEQKKILVECTNKIIDGRSISLKVALNFTKEEAVKMEEAGAEANTEAAIAVAAEN